MKILAIKPLDTGKYEDIFEVFCKCLEKDFGYEIFRAPMFSAQNNILSWKPFKIEDIPTDIDVIWAPFEPLVPVALYLRDRLNKPVVGHYEIVIPNRVNIDSIDNYYFNESDDKLFENQVLKDYYLYSNAYADCNIKTITDTWTMMRIEKFIGKNIRDNLFIQPYPFNNELFEPFRDETIKEENQIFSVCRLVNHKRLHHVIKALSLIDNPPLFVIAGTGNEYDKLKTLAESLKVPVKFVGEVNDEEKAKLIQQSKLCIYLWAWLPIGEAAFFKKPSITYYGPDTYDRLGNIPIYAEANNINHLASVIKLVSSDDHLREYYGKRAYDLLMSGKTNTKLKKDACFEMDKIFKLAKEIKV